MKIVFMGTPDFAVPALKALAESAKHEVSLVVTQPDRPRGRSGKPAPSDVKLCAEQYGIPVFQPEKVREEASVERLRRENADIFVVAAFGQLLPKTILEMPRFGCINIHGSLLPAYRGAAPVQWAVLDGQKEAGDTIMQMNEGLDTGDILMQESIPLSADETAGSLYDKLSSMGGPLLLKALDAIEAGTVTPVPQGDSGTHYAKMLRKEMGNIDWTKSAEEIGRLVRGLNPWPSAFTHLNGKMLKIWDADVYTKEQAEAEFPEYSTDFKGAEPGQIAAVLPHTFFIGCGKDLLKVNEVQAEGKKRMTSDAFLRGSRLEKGMELGK